MKEATLVLVCLAIVFAQATNVVGDEDEVTCYGEWANHFNGSCYLVFVVPWDLRLSQMDAMKFCKDTYGTDLLSIDSQAELDQLGRYINVTYPLRIGQSHTFHLDKWMGSVRPNYPIQCQIISNWRSRNGDHSIYYHATKVCATDVPRNYICEGNIEYVNRAVEINTIKGSVTSLAKQLISQNLAFEERIRSDGDSGLKLIRHTHTGSRPYHSETHNSFRVAAIHDHANNIRTVGLGEFIAVLNGVEFRTRHNDYRLMMPSRTDPAYGSMEEIPFPAVPPSVTNKPDVQGQIDEMKEYFRAWANQDTRIRDYRQYFKPVLCYLEGMWTNGGDDIDEPFYSDRHFIDAATWSELQEKVRFTSYTGSKSLKENYSYLPVRIQKLFNDTYPIFAQWNYRIACHPVSRDIPLNRFRVVDDISSRMRNKQTVQQYENSRAARFELNPHDLNTWREDGVYGPRRGLLDKLMEEVPGRDNYMANLTDDAFGFPAEDIRPGYGTINAGFYHRWYKSPRNDAMGVAVRARGFGDNNVFMAMTNQSKVASIELDDECKVTNGEIDCKHYSQRWSYAIPLEIIYLTPLNAWNPYDLEYKGPGFRPEGRTVTANGRNGGNTPDKAYNGTNSVVYYRTPQEFFSGDTIGKDPADTSRGSVGVLDRNGVVRPVRPTGTRIFFPNIPGIGVLRQRYPIMPVHGEGDAVWKELQALKDIMFNPTKYRHMYPDGGNVQPPSGDLTLQVAYTTANPPGPHSHIATLTQEQVTNVHNGQTVSVITSEDNGHSHTLSIRYIQNPSTYVFDSCDGQQTCFDGHSNTLIPVSAYDIAV